MNTCPYCGAGMDNPRRRQCGKRECELAHKRARYRANYYADVEATRARKREYKRSRPDVVRKINQRYRERTDENVPCSVCGKMCRKTRVQINRGNYVCGNSCRVILRWGYYLPLRSEWEKAKREAERVAQSPREPEPAKRRVWVAGNCAECAKPFVIRDQLGARFCSRACQRRPAKDRRRARKRSAYVAPVRRAEIYKRDNYMCQLCHEPLAMDEAVPHPLAPVIDHIVPLANGGTHEPSNCQAAHFLCNSKKGDRDVTRLAHKQSQKTIAGRLATTPRGS